MQEDEQRPSPAAAAWNHEHLAELPVEQAALQGEVNDAGPERAPVPAPQVANGDRADRRRGEEQQERQEREESPHRAERMVDRYSPGKLASWRSAGRPSTATGR